MDNQQNNNKPNANSSGKNNRGFKDPMTHEQDDSRMPGERVQPTEIMQSNQRVSSADSRVVPAQFIPAAGDMQPVSSIGDVIGSILHFKWTILIVFLMIAVPAIAAIWTLVVPKYRAQAEVRVRPIIPYLVFQTEESGKIPLYDSFVNTQVSIILSSVVLQRVVDQPVIQQTQWYQNPPKSFMTRLHGIPPSPIDRLRDGLSVRPRKDTEIIDVAFIDTSAKEAQLIANVILDHYIRYIGEMSDATQDKIYNQLLSQYRSLEDEISVREIAVAELSKTLGTSTPDELISDMRLRLEETKAKLSEVRQNIALFEWEMKRTATVDSNDVLAAADANDISAAAIEKLEKQPKYYQDEEWRKLDNNVRVIQHSIETSLLTPNHPKALKMQKELEFAQEQLQLREQQLDEQLRDRLSSTVGASIATARGLSYEEGLIYLQNELARSKRQEQLLVEELGKQKAEFDTLFENAQKLKSENNTLQHKRELFSAVRQRRDQKTMERNVPGSIEILTRPILPTQPYYDRRIAFTFMMMVLALGVGCGLAYLKAGKTQIIYDPKDMPHPMQVSFLGYIPLTPNILMPDRQPDPTTVESIRVIRTALLSRLNGHDGATVLITSAAEGTGKSTFTMLLGESLARSGKKVLLIDTDFRKMTLSRLFNMPDTSGFMETLSSRSLDKFYIYESEQIPGMSFMPAGRPDNSSPAFEETANGHFKGHINKLRKTYDFILLDSPPVLPVADAVILSNQVEGIIIVERELVSHQKQVNNALARLASAGGHLLGTVFIGSRSQINYA